MPTQITMASSAGGPLDRRLCQVVGVNANYSSRTGTAYHIQVEDRGPLVDRVSEKEVRRVNVIVYANYGEPNARIVYGRDHDFEDVRTLEHNRFIEQQVKLLAEGARRLIEELEDRQVEQIKAALRQYYRTKDDASKKEFESSNALYPFLFSRAWRELREEKPRAAAAPPAAAPKPEPEAPPTDVVYPLDSELRELVIEIERVITELGKDLRALKERGNADDILLQTCRKLIQRAKDTLQGGAPAEFTARRLDMTRTSLLTTWRQVRSRLRAGKSA